MKLQPDSNNDWINQRDPNYATYSVISSEKKGKKVFKYNSLGIGTNRDAWVYGFSLKDVSKKVNRFIDFYNKQARKSQITRDNTKIKWTARLEKSAKEGKILKYNQTNLKLVLYRPFTKKWLYYAGEVVERPRLFEEKWGTNNTAIVTTGRSNKKDFSAIVSRFLPDVQLEMNGQTFIRFDNSKKDNGELLTNSNDNLTKEFANKLGLSLDDTFAYVYGLLSSKEYQAKYQNDLKKDLARIPIAKNKEKYVEIGKELMNLHLNYEEVPAYDKVNLKYSGIPDYKVKKMKFVKKINSKGKLEKDKSTIVFNDSITIENIPEKAYEYVVNGRSAIEWIMDQYQVKTDKKSGITDDPNDFSDDPKYIFNLLLSIINVSVQTVDLINQLPKLKIDE